MPINTPHPDYPEVSERADTTDDAFEGDVKEFVPRLNGETRTQFEARVNRPAYYNIVERTTLALLGALMRKPYTLQGVVGDEPETDNNSFDEFVQSAYQEILLCGRIGLYVDYCNEEQTPKLVTYSAENIINWCDEFIVIEEEHLVRDKRDPYKLVSEKSWRELCFDEAGFYQVRIWKETARGKYAVVETTQPLIRGQRLDYFPFFFVTPYDNTEECSAPPLYNLAVLNIEHFKTSVDYAHGLHFLALPTPWIAGDIYTMDGTQPTELSIGTEKFIHLLENSKVGYLEFGGAGMAAISDHISKIEDRMFSMGSRLLASKRGIESAEALQIRSTSESAILVTLTNSLETGLEKALSVYNQWAGSTVEPIIELNRDFAGSKLSPQDIAALLQTYTAGVITLDTLLARLYDGEIVMDVNLELAALGKAPEIQPVDVVV
jgi:hypothetical protein